MCISIKGTEFPGEKDTANLRVRLPVWRGREVPEVLLSGHHANIEKWRRAQSEELTAQRRPDLMEESGE